MPTAGYSPDLSTFSLAKLKTHLRTARLLPGQRILGEHLDERFACLEQNGIANLAQLQTALKSGASVAAFARATGLPEAYLIVLRREVNSYQPRPVALKDFPGLAPEIIRRLAQAGISNTAQLFPYVRTPVERAAFARQHRLEGGTVLELARLADMARLKWVGPKFARLLLAAGYGSIEKIAAASGEELYRALMRANETGHVYEGKFGSEDLQAWIETVVRGTPAAIQY